MSDGIKKAELRYRLLRALNEEITKDTLKSFAAAGIVLDEAGAFGIAELRVTERNIRRFLHLHQWSCRDMPTPPPDVRRWTCRKFYAVVDQQGRATDAGRVRHATVDEWFMTMASLADDLPDFPHSPPPVVIEATG